MYRIFKLLRRDNSGFDLDQPFSNQFSPWTVAPLTQNEDDKWSRTTNDLHYSHFHNGDDIFLLSNFRSVKPPGHVTTSQICEDRFPSDINQSLSLAPSFPDESWLMRHESWFVKMARAGPHTQLHRSLSSSPHPAAVTTIFKTRTHQLKWRMAERKSFFCVWNDKTTVSLSQGVYIASSSLRPVSVFLSKEWHNSSQEDVRILRMSNWEFPSSQSGFASYH